MLCRPPAPHVLPGAGSDPTKALQSCSVRRLLKHLLCARALQAGGQL